MSNLPILENAYRDFLAEEHRIFIWFLQQSEQYAQEEHGMSELPEQTAIAGALPWSFVMNLGFAKEKLGTISRDILSGPAGGVLAGHESDELLDAYFDVYGEGLPDDIDSFWTRHLFYGNYQRTRHTYHITDGLWEQLEGMDWPEDAPAEALEYLPLPAFGLKAPDDTIYTVCYDLLSGEEGSGELELRVCKLEKDGSLTGFTLLHLGDPGKESITIEEGFRRGINTIAEGMQHRGAEQYVTTGGKQYHIDEFRDYMYENAQRIVNVLLYLAGEDDIVERVGSYPSEPYKRHKRNLDGTSFESHIREYPSEADVGVRMQQALRRYKKERDEPASDGSGSKKRPHVRRPHPHLYWTGPGREIPKIRYLGPIAVNMEDPDEREVPPTEQDVE